MERAEDETTMKALIAGTTFDNVSMEEAVVRITQMAQKTDIPRVICTGNLDHLAMVQKDAAFHAVYQAADLVLADGAPIVWLSHLCGTPLKERVTGSDLFWELGRASAATGVRLFFLGGSPGAAARAADAVHRRYPSAIVCGSYCPPKETFDTPQEQQNIWDAVRTAQPDILLVGFGAPKQEKWIQANKERIGVPVSIGVGGTFEMAGGIVKRAPQWMQKSGLEWCWRLAQEPGRLFRRYFLCDLPFLLALTARILADRARPKSQKKTAA